MSEKNLITSAEDIPAQHILLPKLTCRLYAGEKCFGPGVAELLERVHHHQSLRAAAASMGMAYSKAWNIIRNCESSLGWPLLSRTTGGKNGGGAILTPQAVELLSAYQNFCRNINTYADEIFSEYFKNFL